MNTKLYIQGELFSIKTTEFQGAKVVKLQFLNEDEVKGTEIIEVKVSLPEHNVEGLIKGTKVMIPIQIAVVEKTKYYRTDGKIQVSK